MFAAFGVVGGVRPGAAMFAGYGRVCLLWLLRRLK